MKKRSHLLLAAAIVCLACTLNAQTAVPYDSVLAQKTGADAYGMKPYVMALLKKGKTEIADKAQVNELLMGHLKNIGRLADEGKLVLAGPMTAGTGIEGIYVFNVKTIAEAQALSETDPAVKAGLFAMEYHPWYATAALMELIRIHKTLEKKKRF